MSILKPLPGCADTGKSVLITFFKFIYPMMGARTKETKVAKATNFPILPPKTVMTTKFTIARRIIATENCSLLVFVFGDSRPMISKLTRARAS